MIHKLCKLIAPKNQSNKFNNLTKRPRMNAICCIKSIFAGFDISDKASVLCNNNIRLYNIRCCNLYCAESALPIRKSKNDAKR